MKQYLKVVISLLAIGFAAFAYAQSTPTTTPSVSLFPNFHSINAQLKLDMDKMKSDYISGKLTQAQLKTIKDQIKAVRIQELKFRKQNGTGVDLTSNQINQLNTMLTAITP